eukprot:scaffold12194_cov129-Cylindrotheca_fusiformis.AAC.17
MFVTIKLVSLVLAGNGNEQRRTLLFVLMSHSSRSDCRATYGRYLTSSTKTQQNVAMKTDSSDCDWRLVVILARSQATLWYCDL